MSTARSTAASGPSKEPTTETQEMRLEAAAPREAAGLTHRQIVLRKFRRNLGAMVSVAVLLLIVLLSLTSIGVGPIPGWWKYSHTDMSPVINAGRPTLGLTGLGEHPFGQDTTGRDLFAMTMRGTQTSLFVMVIVGAVSAFFGVLVGGVSGYFRGWVEAVLMRFTDIVIIIPLLVLTAVLGQMVISRIPPGTGRIIALAVLIGIVAWTGLARLVRGEFLTLREREFVDAARLAGASSSRIIVRHIMPNAVGVIIVNVTLLMSAAILLETALSYLGYGIQAPDWSLGSVISANQSAFSTRPWLFWWPGLFIVAICLCINFIGDGLRDAFDPRQQRVSVRRSLLKKGGLRAEHPQQAAVAGSPGDVAEASALTTPPDTSGTRTP